jgi:hypothetical protein
MFPVSLQTATHVVKMFPASLKTVTHAVKMFPASLETEGAVQRWQESISGTISESN